MGIEEFLQDPCSTTGYFKQLSHNYELEILQHGMNGDNFERIIAIYLNKIPCMLAISKTKIKFPLFFDILQNAGHIPIGTRLFATESNISRINLQIGKAVLTDIHNVRILEFLQNMKYSTDDLYYRTSDFIHQEQIMHLDEYALPGLIKILANTKL